MVCDDRTPHRTKHKSKKGLSRFNPRKGIFRAVYMKQDNRLKNHDRSDNVPRPSQINTKIQPELTTRSANFSNFWYGN